MFRSVASGCVQVIVKFLTLKFICTLLLLCFLFIICFLVFCFLFSCCSSCSFSSFFLSSSFFVIVFYWSLSFLYCFQRCHNYSIFVSICITQIVKNLFLKNRVCNSKLLRFAIYSVTYLLPCVPFCFLIISLLAEQLISYTGNATANQKLKMVCSVATYRHLSFQDVTSF